MKAFTFDTQYNRSKKAYEVYVTDGFPGGETIYPKGQTHGIDHPWPVPHIVRETKNTVRVACGGTGMGDPGFDQVFYKTEEAAWKAAVNSLKGKKVLTLEETKQVQHLRALKNAKKGLKEALKSVDYYEKRIAELTNDKAV
jgi:hypothetical protein